MRHSSRASRLRCRLGFDAWEGTVVPLAVWPEMHFWPAYHQMDGAGSGGSGAPSGLQTTRENSIPPPTAAPLRPGGLESACAPEGSAVKPTPAALTAPTETPAASGVSTQRLAGPPSPASNRARKRSDLEKWAGTQRTTFAIAFTDVIDSTGLWNALGNERMAGVLRAHFDQGRRLVEAHHGYLIRTTGDSLLLAFRTAAAALDFTLAYAARTGHVLIQIRAGIHVGPVQIENDDVYGTTVNYAARVIGKAKGSEIWVSSRARSDIEEERVRSHGALHWVPHRQCTLKGLPGKHLLWSVQVAEEEAE